MKLVALFLLSFSSYLVLVFAEGRVEHQKLNQEAALLPSGWVFGVQLDFACHKKRDVTRVMPHWFICLTLYTAHFFRNKKEKFHQLYYYRSKLLLSSNVAFGTFPLIVFILIIACLCRRPSWTPKTQRGGSSAASWLSFWCSTRFRMS